MEAVAGEEKEDFRPQMNEGEAEDVRLLLGLNVARVVDATSWVAEATSWVVDEVAAAANAFVSMISGTSKEYGLLVNSDDDYDVGESRNYDVEDAEEEAANQQKLQDAGRRKDRIRSLRAPTGKTAVRILN